MRIDRICVGALAAIALTTGNIAHADDAVTLATTYKVGVVTRYKVTSDSEVSGNAAATSRTIKQEIKEIKPNGDVVFTITDEGGTYTLGGQENPLDPGAPVTVVRNKVNRITEYKTDEGEGIQTPEIKHLMMMLEEAVFPDKPVKPGDSWQVEMDNPAVKSKKVVLKETYVGIEKVDGADLWKIKETASPATDDQGATMTFDQTLWLDPSNGHVVKAETTVKDLPTRYGAMKSTLVRTKIKSD